MNWVHWFRERRLHSAPNYLPPVGTEHEYQRQIEPAQHLLSGEPTGH